MKSLSIVAGWVAACTPAVLAQNWVLEDQTRSLWVMAAANNPLNPPAGQFEEYLVVATAFDPFQESRHAEAAGGWGNFADSEGSQDSLLSTSRLSVTSAVRGETNGGAMSSAGTARDESKFRVQFRVDAPLTVRLRHDLDAALVGQGIGSQTVRSEVRMGRTGSPSAMVQAQATPLTGPVHGDQVLVLLPGSYTVTADATLWVSNQQDTWFTGTGGLTVTLSVPCYPDCDGDSLLTLADFGCFQTRFSLGLPYADCNGDVALNLADFGCFQTSFALGCP